jgi:hypothetical protein
LRASSVMPAREKTFPSLEPSQRDGMQVLGQFADGPNAGSRAGPREVRPQRHDYCLVIVPMWQQAATWDINRCWSPTLESGSTKHSCEASYDRYSCLRPCSCRRFRPRLVHSVCNCGQFRRKLEHGRCDHQRTLREDQDWPWHTRQPYFFDRRTFRLSPHSIDRPGVALRASTDECGGRPAHRARDRTIHAGPSSWEMDRDWALRPLLGLLDRYSHLTGACSQRRLGDTLPGIRRRGCRISPPSSHCSR